MVEAGNSSTGSTGPDDDDSRKRHPHPICKRKSAVRIKIY
jgi:hypothetical protein